jgi:tripartite-type tricarboxylate transporter receptor subunit TctC
MYSKYVSIAAAAMFVAGTSAQVLAQPYPNKPIRLIAPYPPGGGVDAVARIIGMALTDSLGQQVVIENRGGASGRIGTEVAARASSDGYTLLLGSIAPNAVLPAAYSKLPYDAIRDFAPIALVATTDYVLSVHPSLPARSVKELIALAKKQPDKINYASTGNLGGPHLAGELFKQLAKVQLVHIAYKGGGPATSGILSGDAALIFGTGPAVSPHVQSGRLIALATTGTKRSRFMPNLPTVNETLPGHVVEQWYGLLAPAGVPEAVVTRIHAEAAKAVKDLTVVKQLNNLATEAIISTPSEFAAHIKAEIAKWSRVVKESGIAFE